MESIFYIDKGDCANCYQCVRVCPTDAISINNFQASIIASRCIKCAKCIDVCPQNIVKTNSQIEKSKNIILTNKTIVASISPAWVSEFKNISENKIVEALKLLGFTYVNETTLGAEVVVKESFKKIRESGNGLKITTICPVVNDLITKKYPKLIDSMIEVASPTVVHARQLKQLFGEDTKVITIGTCVAAKDEVNEYSDLISASITFNELKEWLKSEKISLSSMIGHESYVFEPIKAKEHTEYIVRGSIFNRHTTEKNISSDSVVSNVSGMDYIIEALNNLNEANFTRKIVLDTYACNGGCIFGKGATMKNDQFVKLNKIRDYDIECLRNQQPNMPLVSSYKKFKLDYNKDKIDNSVIVEILQSLSLDTSAENINCGACGYFDCRQFAKQVALGYAHKEMCLWYRKNAAKSALLKYLQITPFGVAIVDSSMKIIEANRSFAKTIGPEMLLTYDNYNSLNNVDCSKTIFAKYIDRIFTRNKPTVEKDIQIKDKLFKLIVVKVEDTDNVIVILRNSFQDEMRNDEIVNRTRLVIDDNLKTIQQIAYLLGETASRTEAVLNSIIESQKVSDERE